LLGPRRHRPCSRAFPGGSGCVRIDQDDPRAAGKLVQQRGPGAIEAENPGVLGGQLGGKELGHPPADPVITER
jgi:hypothetical protein